MSRQIKTNGVVIGANVIEPSKLTPQQDAVKDRKLYVAYFYDKPDFIEIELPENGDLSDITQEEIRSVGFEAADYEETAARYNPQTLQYGYNTMPDGEEIYYIPNPALGLWINREAFGE